MNTIEETHTPLRYAALLLRLLQQQPEQTAIVHHLLNQLEDSDVKALNITLKFETVKVCALMNPEQMDRLITALIPRTNLRDRRLLINAAIEAANKVYCWNMASYWVSVGEVLNATALEGVIYAGNTELVHRILDWVCSDEISDKSLITAPERLIGWTCRKSDVVALVDRMFQGGIERVLQAAGEYQRITIVRTVLPLFLDVVEWL